MKKTGENNDFAFVLHGGVRWWPMPERSTLSGVRTGERKRRAVGSHPRDAKVALDSQAKVVSLREVGMDVEGQLPTLEATPQLGFHADMTNKTVALRNTLTSHTYPDPRSHRR